MALDWQAVAAETVERLRTLIRFDTTNPPGHETPLARHLADELIAAGVEAQVLEAVPGRGNLVARLRGTGAGRPLLLLSHLDVVPVEPQRWTHPPFAAELAEGCVWGRGSIDCKLATAVQMQLMLLCRRLQLPLERDLVIVAAADEELGGTNGVGWLVSEHPEWFDAEYAINEGGGFAVPVAGRPLYTFQLAEKGSAPVDVIAHGRPGHSSVPHGDNPLFALGQALSSLGKSSMPHRIIPTVRAFFEHAARAQEDARVAGDLLALLAPESHHEALARLPVSEPVRLMFAAMIRNTCAPTVVQAGLKRNVIPSEATVQLSGRPLPGVDRETFLEEVRQIVGPDVELRLEEFRSGLEFENADELFCLAADALSQHAPGAALVPYMQTGGTDARFLRDLDMTVCGFIPMREEAGKDYFELCHGHDERVSAANVAFGVQVLYHLLGRLNGL